MKYGLDNFIQRVIPYFVKFYGEEYRELIEDRLGRCVPLFYDTYDSRKKELTNNVILKKIELSFKILKEFGYNVPESDIANSNNPFYTFSFYDRNSESFKFLDLLFGDRKFANFDNLGIRSISLDGNLDVFKINKNIKFFSKMGIELNIDDYLPFINDPNNQETINKINSYINFIKDLDVEFKEFENSLNDEYRYINKCEKSKSDLSEKYLLEFLGSIDKYLVATDKEKINNYKDGKYSSFYTFKNDLDILKIVGDSLSSSPILESFTLDSDKVLSDREASLFAKDNIISNRVKYFKLQEVYDGTLNFINSDTAKKNRIPLDFVTDVLNKKDKYYKSYNETFIIETSSYKKDKDLIDSFNFINNSGVNTDVYLNDIIMITPTVDKDLNLYNILCYSPSLCPTNFKDVFLIHELNHIVESSLLDYKDGNLYSKCGFEYINNNDDERNFEQLSEAFNQIIAILITEYMHNDDVYLLDDSTTSKLYGGSSYEHQLFLLVNFWKEFRDLIIKSRIENDLSSLLDVIGEDNFNELNNIINEHHSLHYYSMMDDVIKKRDTELSRKYYELKDKSRDIVEKMKEHSNSKGL